MPSESPSAPGTSVRSHIPLAVPNVRGREWEYVKTCLDGGWVAVGGYLDRFEHELGAVVGAEHVLVVSSGTAALHLALLAAGVAAEDEVIVPALTFIAPANAVRYVGAWPVFVDVDPVYAQLDSVRVEEFLRTDCTRAGGVTRNLRTGRPVTAILPVDLLGHPVDIDALLALAEQFGLTVIEDASESLGACVRGLPVGVRSRVATFSFNGNKLLTTGGGGALASADARLIARARYLAAQAKDDPVAGTHGAVGHNYRLSNVQAALGCAQLEQLDGFLDAKRRIAARYTHAFAGVPGLVPMGEASWACSSFWMYTLRIDPAAAGFDARELQRRLAASGIETRQLWQPLHLSAAHRGHAVVTSCPAAESWHRGAVSLPCSTALPDEDQDRVITAVLRLAERSHCRTTGEHA